MRIFLMILLLTMTAGSLAGEREYMRLPDGRRLSYERLFEEVSLPGEKIDQFAARISPRLRAFSDETKFEACGRFAKSADGRYGVIVGTNHSHIACAVRNTLLPEGMKPILQTIHSHGVDSYMSMNKSDKALMGEQLVQTRGISSVAGQTLDNFSGHDYSGGAGYLAIPGGRTLHQNGKTGSEREVFAEPVSAEPATP